MLIPASTSSAQKPPPEVHRCNHLERHLFTQVNCVLLVVADIASRCCEIRLGALCPSAALPWPPGLGAHGHWQLLLLPLLQPRQGKESKVLSTRAA